MQPEDRIMIKEEKTNLRKQIKSRRESLSADYIKKAGENIAKNVISSKDFEEAKVIFAYISVKEEPDTRPIIETALKMGKTVCVPKCYGKGIMDAIAIQGFDDLQPGLLNIPEPYKLENKIEPEEIDLGIIPCIAAGKDHKRIGHGAGYYDRFLEKARCKMICLCFEELLSENIPMDENDKTMDAVFTEKGIY